jgi:filamentous hemagglutinin
LKFGCGDTDITLSAPSGTLDNTAGRIAVNSGNLTLGAGALINTDSRIEHAGAGALSIRVATLSDQRGQITGNGVLNIVAGEIDHRDASTSAQQITIAAPNLNNTDGLIAASAHLAVNAGSIDNTRGSLRAQGGDATLHLGDLNNAAGSIYAGGKLETTAASVSNSGSLYAAGDQHLAASGVIVNSGVIAAQGHTTISADNLASGTTGLLGAGVKADGSLAPTGNLSVFATNALAANGQNLAAGSATLAGISVDLRASQTSAANITLSASGGNVTTSNALVTSAGTLAVTAGAAGQALVNTHGTLSAGQLDIQAANLDNKQGAIIQSGAGDTRIVLTSNGGVLDNTLGRIAVNSNSVGLGADMLINTDGRIEHAGGGVLSIAAGTMNDERGRVTSNGGVEITAGEFNHRNANTSGRALSVRADSLDNRAGQLLQSGAGAMALQVAGKLDNAGGEIAGDSSLAVQAGAIDNFHGSITSGASANVASMGALRNVDGVLAAAHALAVAGHAIDNTRGAIQAGDGALTLGAASLLNVQGVLNAGADLNANIGGELRNDGVLYSGRDQTLNVGGALINTGSIASGGNTTITAAIVGSSSASLLGAGINKNGSLAQTGALTVSAAHGIEALGQNLAAGNASLSGASLDLGGSQTGAANIALAATSGNVNAAGADVHTAGMLSVTANAAPTQSLINAHGSLSAGLLALNVANLENTHGLIIQGGAGDTDITLSTPGGTFDNTAGRIAANSGSLTLGAGTLVNTDGSIEHAGAGTLSIGAATLSDQRGQITGNGALNIVAGEIDHRAAITAAQQIMIAAANLENSAGQIAQLSGGLATVTASASLINTAGRIESNGGADVRAAVLENGRGRITAAGSAAVGASTSLNNTDGLIAASAHLAVNAGSVDNTRGSLQSQGGDATLHLDDLNNATGSIYAAGKLDTTAASVNNSGSLYAGGDQRLAASGAIVNSGVIAAQGHTTISADSLASGTASLLGAGVKADGSLAPTGDLNVATLHALAAKGQNLAAGSVTLAGGAIDLSASQTSAANIALSASASAGNVTTSNATVATAGTLAVTAGGAGQALVNSHGTLSAGQLDIEVANLDNTHGAIIQNGAGDTRIVLTSNGGVLDNTLGRIAVNSNSVGLGADMLINTDGRIEHAGAGVLDISAGSFDGQRGQITGNGSLHMTAGDVDHRNASTVAQQIIISATNLDNRHGGISQIGSGQARISVSGNLDNQNGAIASNGDFALSAGALNNQAGDLHAAGASTLSVVVGNTLDNSNGGRLATGGNITINAGMFANELGQVSAGGQLTANAAGGIQNGQGLLVAGGDVRATGASFDNIGGKIASALGNVSVISSGVTGNDSGVIQAAGDVELRNGGLTNARALGYAAAGLITGNKVDIDSNGQALDNRLGTIASTQALNIRSGALSNDAGLIESGAALALDTGGQTLGNTDAAGYSLLHPGVAGGIIGAGTATLHLGDWNNAGGYFGAGGAIGGSTGNIDNTQSGGVGGLIVGQSSLNLSLTSLNNQGGQIQALGDIVLNAGSGAIDNRHSLIRSGATLNLTAGAVDNRATQEAGQGLEGDNIVANTGFLNNAQGAIRADNNVTVGSSGSVDNNAGLISAGNTLVITDPGAFRSLVIANSAGTLISGSETNIRAASLSGDGRLLTFGDLALDLSGDHVHGAGAQIVANDNASIIIGGDLSNFGELRAGAQLAITARSIDNTAGGDINAGTTRISAAGTLNNRGVIDGTNTLVSAGVLNNVGTGRIYGDHLSIGAGLVSNDVEAGVAATIAARSRLDIGAQTLSNVEHALIFSAGDMAIGGALDGQGYAVGRAGSVTNASANIEALGTLSLSAAQVNNLNNHFTTQLGPASAPQLITEYQGAGTATRYLLGTPGVYTFTDESLHLMAQGVDYDSWTQYDSTTTTRQTVVATSEPSRIAAGGNLVIDSGNVLNDNSHIVAGGMLSIDPSVLHNTATQGQKITSSSGTATAYWRIHKKGTDETGTSTTDYAPPDLIQSIALTDSSVEQYTASGSTGGVPGATSTIGVNGATSAAGPATATINSAAIVKVAFGVGAVGAAGPQQAGAAEGVDGENGTNRNAGSGQHGTVVTATGEQATAASPVARAGSTGPMPGHVATGQVGDRLVDSAEGVDSANGTGHMAGMRAVEAGGTATGAPVPTAIGQDTSERAGLSVANAAGIIRTPGEAARTVAAAGVPGWANAGEIVPGASTHSPAGAQTVRTNAPAAKIPNASVYQTHSAPSDSYLIETDPRFTSFGQWLGSDYMLARLQLDGSVTQKRLGDGYYEQSLIRAQVTQLTGQRYLADFSNDDDEYRSLMDAGVAYAKTWNLRPGVALSADQMAALTGDMVWLVEQSVTLADGTVQKVLVPQLYVRVRDGDLDGSGALLAGKEVSIRVKGDMSNSGTIVARDTLQLSADNAQNVGGQIHGDAVSVAAKTDLNNIGGVISANSALFASAGRDINVETTNRTATSGAGTNAFARTTIDRVAGLYVTGDGATAGGTLAVSAGRDLNLIAAQVGNAAKDGGTVISAGRDLNFGTVTTSSSNTLVWDANSRRSDSANADVGSQVQAAGAITLKAGADINARAANVQAGAALVATAGNNINLVAGVNAATLDEAHQHDEKTFLHRETITTRDTLDRTSALGTSLGGDTINLVAGSDIKITGSSVVGDHAVNLIAGKDVTIAAATDTANESHARSVKESGFLSGGGFGISYGIRTTTTDQSRDAAVQSGQARNIVGSIGGDLNVSAGNAVKVSGSDLSAGKDMSLAGKIVAITPGADDVKGKFTSKMTQDAFTLAIGGSVVHAIQAAQSMGAAAEQTSSGRLKALAAASAAMAAKDAAIDLAANGPSVNISLTVGHSESESTELTASRTHGGSVLAAGNNVAIAATGGGKASNIDIVGSDVRAAGNVSLVADNQVNLLAAQDTESQHSQSKSWSAAVGVAAEISSSGPKMGYTASVSASRSNVDGEGTTQVNSHVVAGDRVMIASGGDTNLKGAVASGSQVVADVKGNLNIESLQDTATLDGKRQSVSVSATVGAGAGFSASISQSKVHNDYASVGEQSGIRAGDGGFQLQVAGNTDLKGGVISSSEEAIKDGRNSLATAALSFSDIQNRGSTDASGVSLGVNVGKNQDGGTFSPSMAPGIGQVSASQGSVTRSGVSRAALTISDQQAGQAVANLNRDVTTGNDMAGALTKGRSGAKALDEVGAQTQITSAAMPRLAKGIGDYAETKVAELKEQGKTEEAAKWAEGGIYRVAAHAALGAMGGGLGGAAGATASAEAAPTLTKLEAAVQDKLANAGMSSDVANATAKLIAGGAAAAIGGVAGGSMGATTGLNAEANNRQLHPKEIDWIKKNAKSFAQGLADKLERPVTEAEALFWLTTAGESNVDKAYQYLASQQKGMATSEESLAFTAAKQYISGSAKGTFTDDRGQQQRVLVATGSDFYKPEVYSEYRNNSSYREFYWLVKGDNLRPDNPTPQELSVYNERERQRVLNGLKAVATGSIPAVMAGVTGTILARLSRPGATTIGPTTSSTATNSAAMDARTVGINSVVDVETVDATAAHRVYLNSKFGRTGDLNLDINIRGNEETATNFFRLQGVPTKDIPSYLTGIDFTQPVSIQALGSGKQLWQYQTPGAPQGNWYSFSPSVQATELGISPLGFNRATQTIEQKILNPYLTEQPINMLRSTSASVNDFWSVRGQSYPTIGSARQLFSTQKAPLVLTP